MSHSAQENSLEWAKLFNSVGGHHLAGLDVGFAAPVERVPLELKSKALAGCFEHTNAFGNHLFPNPVPGNDCDVEGFHGQLRSFSFLG